MKKGTELITFGVQRSFEFEGNVKKDLEELKRVLVKAGRELV